MNSAAMKIATAMLPRFSSCGKSTSGVSRSMIAIAHVHQHDAERRVDQVQPENRQLHDVLLSFGVPDDDVQRARQVSIRAGRAVLMAAGRCYLRHGSCGRVQDTAAVREASGPGCLKESDRPITACPSPVEDDESLLIALDAERHR